MTTVTLSPKAQIAIPKENRESLHWKTGDKLVLIEKGKILHVVKVGKLREAMGSIKGLSSRGLREKRDRID